MTSNTPHDQMFADGDKKNEQSVWRLCSPNVSGVGTCSAPVGFYVTSRDLCLKERLQEPTSTTATGAQRSAEVLEMPSAPARLVCTNLDFGMWKPQSKSSGGDALFLQAKLSA